MPTAVEKQSIAVIGAGLMGHGIAQVFAVHGHPVFLMDLEDTALSNAIESIRANLALMARSGIGSEAEIEPTLQRITTTTDLGRAASPAHFVIEAVPEKLDLKQDLFRDLDSLCSPDTILGTNTSVISISEIAERANHRERIVGTHFWNPPYLIPMVELIPGDESDPEVVDRTFDLLREVGKHPVFKLDNVVVEYQWSTSLPLGQRIC